MHPSPLPTPAGGRPRGTLYAVYRFLHAYCGVCWRVRNWLKAKPKASIVSISQNDYTGACECDACHALDEQQGTLADSVLTIVNYIAEQLEPESPHVAFDMFAQPLEHPSNEAFARDIHDWSRLTNRLYLWDYTINFAHCILPHPNWFSLEPNVRFFHQHGVRGLFKQGAYQPHGAEMVELRAWVLAQPLWNPYQNNQKLIDEFIQGYYGRAVGYIREYLNLMHDAAKGFYMDCFPRPTICFHSR